MRINVLIIIICLRVINSYGQHENNINFECIIQESSIVGAKFYVEMKTNTDFSLEIPNTDSFTYFKTFEVIKRHVKNKDTITQMFSKRLEFECKKSGLIVFPQILVFINNDSIYTDQKIVNIFSRDTLTNRKHDKDTGLLKIENIDEFDRDIDITLESKFEKSKIKLGDSLRIKILIKTALSNSIEFLKIKNIGIENYLIVHSLPEKIRRKLVSVNGVNYHQYEFLDVFVIPQKKGHYIIDGGVVEVNVGIDKKTGNSFSKFAEQDFKSIELAISKIQFRVR